MAGFDGFHLGVDADQGLAETVELFLGFAFRRLDHHGAGHGPGYGGRVEAIVHKALGHILDGDVLKLAQVKDALVGDEVAVAAVEDGEVGLQPLGDVVRVENGILGRLSQAGTAHCGDIDPGDRENAGAAPGGGSDSARRVFPAQVHDGMTGQELHQVFRHADGAHARTAAAVRDAKRLVQIHVADIGADVPGAA